jgi:hypothetical protein
MKLKILLAAGLIICLSTIAYSRKDTAGTGHYGELLDPVQLKKDDNLEWWKDYRKEWGDKSEVPVPAEPFIEELDKLPAKSKHNGHKKTKEFSEDMIYMAPYAPGESRKAFKKRPFPEIDPALPTPEEYQW